MQLSMATQSALGEMLREGQEHFLNKNLNVFLRIIEANYLQSK